MTPAVRSAMAGSFYNGRGSKPSIAESSAASSAASSVMGSPDVNNSEMTWLRLRNAALSTENMHLTAEVNAARKLTTTQIPAPPDDESQYPGYRPPFNLVKSNQTVVKRTPVAPGRLGLHPHPRQSSFSQGNRAANSRQTELSVKFSNGLGKPTGEHRKTSRIPVIIYRKPTVESGSCSPSQGH